MFIADPLASFRRDLRAQRRSKHTISNYTLAIIQFCEWLGLTPATTELKLLDRDNLKRFVLEHAHTWAASTTRTKIAGIRAFGTWLVEESYMEVNPVSNLPLPVAKDTPPEVLTDEQLTDILNHCKGRDFFARRDTAIIRTLLDTGVRVSELCGMTLSGTDLDEELTQVRGKGNKLRNVYFSSKTVAALDRYVRARGGHPLKSSDALWLGQRGVFTPDGVRSRLELIGNEVGIPNLHPHRFRHTWAHDHLLNETSTVDLKRLAGWSSDTMLSRYGASGADVRAAAAARRAQRGDRV